MEDFEERVERAMRKWKDEQGWLTTETGGPCCLIPEDEQIKKNYRENPNDFKARADYLALLERQRVGG